jgi:hypothetical protein
MGWSPPIHYPAQAPTALSPAPVGPDNSKKRAVPRAIRPAVHYLARAQSPSSPRPTVPDNSNKRGAHYGTGRARALRAPPFRPKAPPSARRPSAQRPPRPSACHPFVRENFPTLRAKFVYRVIWGGSNGYRCPGRPPGAETAPGSVISRTAPWSVRSAGFGPFWLGIAHLPILGRPPAHRGARRRIGVRRRCHPPIVHASHEHQILTDCSQVNSSKDFTRHVISM